jgi:hypothetical protein
VQFIINPAHLPAPFESIRRESKTHEHGHQNEAVPDLQPPLDGFEDFHPLPFNYMVCIFLQSQSIKPNLKRRLSGDIVWSNFPLRLHSMQ